MSSVVTSANFETQHLCGAAALVAGEALSALDAVCIKADGYVYKADANEPLLVPCVGLAENAAASGATVDIVDTGWIDGASGLTPGDYIYLSTTAGGVTQSKNTIAQVLGIAVTSTRWKLNIQFGYVGGMYA
jgi:hypothetical protein